MTAKRRSSESVYRRIYEIVESTRVGAARSVNSPQVISVWLVGSEVVEKEQRGVAQARYGEQLMKGLAKKLQAEFGTGYSFPNLTLIRHFYLSFPELLASSAIGYAPRSRLGPAQSGQFQIVYRVGAEVKEYQPDFVAETGDSIYMLEVKRRSDMSDPVVLAKRDAAARWCEHATAHTRTYRGKPWHYVLIADDLIAENMTIKGLVSRAIYL